MNYYGDHYSVATVEIPYFVKHSLKRRLKGFTEYRTGAGSILDVGFGQGLLLDAAHETGWDCSGTEYSEPAVAYGVSMNWNVHRGDLISGVLPGPFDVITVTETLEHVIDPVETLREIYQRLRPGGVVWGTTPNAQGISGRLLGEAWSVAAPPEHLHLFSCKGLRVLFRRAGFTKRIEIASSGLNVSEIFAWAKGSSMDSGSRVESAYALNTYFENSKAKRAVKSLANALLNTSRGGDSLQFVAIK